jgi:hypothetical protein
MSFIVVGPVRTRLGSGVGGGLQYVPKEVRREGHDLRPDTHPHVLRNPTEAIAGIGLRELDPGQRSALVEAARSLS